MKTLIKPRAHTEKTIEPKPHPVQHVHWIEINKYRMYCIQPNCDGTHHFFCSCRTEH